MAQASARWRKLIADASPVCAAELLYIGRAFSIVRRAAIGAGADLAIVSAGLGLVQASTRVPAYDLTAEHGANALARRVRGWDSPLWWEAIRTGPFAAPLSKEIPSRNVTLMALTQPYARLLARELETLAAHADRLRIFGRGLTAILPSALHACVMPYDDRLETLGPRGTRGDFAARALADFLANIGGGAFCQDDAERVIARLAPITPPQRRLNARADDATLIDALTAMRRKEPAISMSNMLRELRSETRLACSDARLRRLVASV